MKCSSFLRILKVECRDHDRISWRPVASYLGEQGSHGKGILFKYEAIARAVGVKDLNETTAILKRVRDFKKLSQELSALLPVLVKETYWATISAGCLFGKQWSSAQLEQSVLYMHTLLTGYSLCTDFLQIKYWVYWSYRTWDLLWLLHLIGRVQSLRLVHTPPGYLRKIGHHVISLAKLGRI